MSETEFEDWLRGLPTQTLTEELKDDIMEAFKAVIEHKE